MAGIRCREQNRSAYRIKVKIKTEWKELLERKNKVL
jgi:hypothetical protein